MRAISLQSGSNGNCIYVEADSGGRTVRLLFDAGISGKRAMQRLTDSGRDIRQVDAVLISHEHSDHISGMGVYHRKFDLPVYATAKTYQAAAVRRDLGRIADVRHFQAGSVLRFGGVSVETIPTPHDAEEGVAFVVDDGRRRLGILTDLGHVFAGLSDVIGSLDAAVLESNYDCRMLATGPYPEFLKRRIRGPAGHISNIESAELVRTSAGARMKWVALAHMSEHNNDPAVALATHRKVLGQRMPIHLTSRHSAGNVLEV